MSRFSWRARLACGLSALAILGTPAVFGQMRHQATEGRRHETSQPASGTWSSVLGSVVPSEPRVDAKQDFGSRAIPRLPAADQRPDRVTPSYREAAPSTVYQQRTWQPPRGVDQGARAAGQGWNRWWYYGRWWPWYGVASGSPSYYGIYGRTAYPSDYSYGYSYPYDLGPAYDTAPYTNDYTLPQRSYEPLPVEPAAVRQSVTVPTTEAAKFFSEAVTAFREGSFAEAVRLAGHAVLDDPRNPDVHLLLSMGLFAMGEYRAAAAEAHAVAVLGDSPDWPAVYQLYGSVEPYTRQLRALERFVRQHPGAPEGRFLLGFHYMISGYRDAANAEFTLALRATPEDHIAADMIEREGGALMQRDVAARMSRRPTEQSGGAMIGRPSPNLGNMARNLPGPPSPIR